MSISFRCAFSTVYCEVSCQMCATMIILKLRKGFPWTFRTTTVGAPGPCPLLCPFSVPWPKISQSTTQGCYEAVSANIRFKNAWTMGGKVRDTLKMGKINKPRETLGSSIHGTFLPYPMCNYWHVSFLSHPAVNKQPLPPGSPHCLRRVWRKPLRIGQRGEARIVRVPLNSL